MDGVRVKFTHNKFRIVAAALTCFIFLFQLPQMFFPAETSKTGEYSSTYTAAEAAASWEAVLNAQPDAAHEELLLMEQSFSALIRRPQTLEIRLRPVYPLENNELYALLYDSRGNIFMQSVLPTDELSPYTGIQLEDVPHLKPGTEYRLVLSSRAPSEDFSPLALLDAVGADCIIHTSTPFDEISLDFYVHGVQLHRTYFAYLLACALGSILLLLLEVTLKNRALRILSYLAVGGAVMLSSLEAVQLLQEAHIYTLPPLPFILSCFIWGLLCCFFFAVSTRLSFAAAASSTIVIVLALANHYTYLLRHSILTPADLLAVGTAINVLDNYRLELSFPVIISLFILWLDIVSSFTLLRVQYYRRGLSKKRLLAGALCLFVSFLGVQPLRSRDFFLRNGLEPAMWDPETTQACNGFLVNFTAMYSFSRPSEPQGYSTQKVKQIAQQYPSDLAGDASGPNIIFIMNESWADFTRAGQLDTSEPVTPFIDSLAESGEAVYGNTVVPVVGAGTSCSEFEALTGASYFFGLSSNPYGFYTYPGMASSAENMKQLGYQSRAQHLMPAANWDRSSGFPRLGFEDFISLEDVEDVEIFRGLPTDAASYKELVHMFDAGNGPQYLFCITAQNHGGYDTGLAVNSQLEILSPAGSYPCAQEYLRLLQKTDAAFAELVNYFRAQPEPTIILMFGDHLPAVEEEFLNATLPENDIFALYTTPFILWANYDLGLDKSASEVTMSSNYLFSYLLETADLPMTGLQKMLRTLYAEYPVISVAGVLDRDGNYINAAAAADLPLIRDYSYMQYNYLVKHAKTASEFYQFHQ